MKNSRTRGFTLFETIIVVGIASIVGTLLVGILVNNNGVYNKQSSAVTEGLNINDTVREIENYTRQAIAITGTYPEDSPIYTTNSTTLILKIPAINDQGVINDVFDFVIITKDSSNAKLLKEYIFPNNLSIRENKNTVLTNILESILFEYLDNNDLPVTPLSAVKIKTTINVFSKTGSASQSRSAIVITSLRNL